MATNVQTINTSSDERIIFTDAAANKVKKLIDEEENPCLSLRVYIMGGGCSGFQYGFKFEKTIDPDDLVTEKVLTAEHEAPSTVRLLCDPLSLQYLEGATIDYREDINGAQFVIKNPNAKTTCGCGSSFSVD